MKQARIPDFKSFSGRELCLALVVGAMAVLTSCGWVGGANKKARSTESARNLMQWGIAFNLFLLDNKNTLPEVGGSDVQSVAEAPNAWYNALPTYLSLTPLSELPPGVKPNPAESSIWVDPSFTKDEFPAYSPYYFCYAMNRYLQPDPKRGSYRIYDLFNPAAVVFLVETASTEPGVLPGKASFRHGDGGSSSAHVLFSDGHVELISRELLTDQTDPSKVSWAPFEGAPEPVATE